MCITFQEAYCIWIIKISRIMLCKDIILRITGFLNFVHPVIEGNYF
jgi:hypothetical protein